MYRSILALVPKPPEGPAVLERAQALAMRHGAALHLAVGNPDLAGKLSGLGVDAHVAVLPEGDGAVADRAHEVRADLMVMGPGEPAVEASLPAGTPVLVMSPASGVAWGGSYRHVVVVLEGGSPPEAVLPYATTLAPGPDTEYTLLTVVRPGYLIGGDSDVRVDVEGVERDRGEASRHVDDVAARLRDRGLTARGRVVTRARRGAAVLELVEEEGVDLVAACCTGLDRRGVGPELVRSGRVDVLLYRARERPLTRWAAGAGAREEG